jgi:hypothetical protein
MFAAKMEEIYKPCNLPLVQISAPGAAALIMLLPCAAEATWDYLMRLMPKDLWPGVMSPAMEFSGLSSAVPKHLLTTINAYFPPQNPLQTIVNSGLYKLPLRQLKRYEFLSCRNAK